MESKNVLKIIVEQYGEKKLLDDKLAGLVSDFIKKDDQLKKRLRLAINERVPQKLYELKSKDDEARERVMQNIASGLSNEYGISDTVACEIVNYFAEALGYQSLGAAGKPAPRQEIHPKTVQVRNETVENTGGNSTGNISNGGYIASQGGWIYYQDWNGDKGLYKIRMDGGGKTKICADEPSSINVAGDFVYYCKKEFMYKSDTGIYKIRTDGREGTKLCAVRATGMTVIGEWIFFVGDHWKDHTVHNKIFRMRTDGSGITKLNDDIVITPNVEYDWIYYNHYTDAANSDNGIYKIRTDGSGRVKLSNDLGSYMNVCDNWIYYVNVADDHTIYKLHTDGKERVKVSDVKAATLNVADGWIYYRRGQYNDSLDYNLFKMRINGSENIKMSDDAANYIHVAGGWVFYLTDKSKYCKVRTDGTDRQLL
ncbi:MAG: DUF5050 domain-containing protein [Oscillospiraceae bacterium]|jgi:hypothetical protein|nr:DUF5050 domain-containing protein [Oscillospiraceae bacterium]